MSTGVDRGCGVGGVPGEEAGVDPGEFEPITQAVSVLDLDVVPVLGIQVGVRVGGRGVGHVGAEEGNSWVAVSNACSFGEPGRRPEEIRAWMLGRMVKLRSTLQPKPSIVMSEYEAVDWTPSCGTHWRIVGTSARSAPFGFHLWKELEVRVSHSYGTIDP